MRYFSTLLFIILFSSAVAGLYAQRGYAVNDSISDFGVSRILNYHQTSSSLHELNDRLLIIDFFGTWCVPCLKAIPKLSALQEKHKTDARIMLVSEETQSKLEAFLKKQNGFTLPVVVDEQQIFVKSFLPPSYPYTVIVGRNGKVLAIPSQEEVTADNIARWITLQDKSTAINSNNQNEPVMPNRKKGNNTDAVMERTENKLVQLSQDFIYAAKTDAETTVFISELQRISMDDLQSGIKTDDEKKAFWINLYNAYTQVALKRNPGQYKKRGEFFRSKQIDIAGQRFSLDDIEHGILRRSKIKWSLGYLNKFFPGKTEKRLRVEKLDYRLHFALNCGAKSCPPIAFYTPGNINQQLDLATEAYLKSEVEFDEVANIVRLPALMNWFRRDFGGKKKMIKLLKHLSIIPPVRDPKIKFKKYDWTLYLQNYKS